MMMSCIMKGFALAQTQHTNPKRAQFIENSVQIRETFNFANPEEILTAVQVHAGHRYGSMLWDLYGEKAGQVFRSWST